SRHSTVRRRIAVQSSSRVLARGPVRNLVSSLCLAVLLAAQAETPVERLHVDWLAPEGCPSHEALAESLEKDVPANRTFHASVRIDEPEVDGRPWRAVVTTTADGDQRTRVVDGSDCERVSKAAALVITLAATSLKPQERTEPPTKPPEPKV